MLKENDANRKVREREGSGHANGMQPKSVPPIRPFSRSLPMQLLRAREALMMHFRPHLRARGLTDQQWRVVRALAEVQSIEILEISERCAIHPASLSQMIPKLVAAGIISRRTNREDQRRAIVELTAKGRRLFKTMGAESEAIYRGLRKRIGAERIETLYNLLDEVIDRTAVPGESSAAKRGEVEFT